MSFQYGPGGNPPPHYPGGGAAIPVLEDLMELMVHRRMMTIRRILWKFIQSLLIVYIVSHIIIRVCRGYSASSMHVGGFQAVAGHSRRLQGLQGLPGASRARKGHERKMRPAAYSQSPEPWAGLKFHAGWSGWTRPPTMAGGGGGVARLRRACKGAEAVRKGI